MLSRLTRWLWRRVPHRHRYQAFVNATHNGAACSRCGFVDYLYPRGR